MECRHPFIVSLDITIVNLFYLFTYLFSYILKLQHPKAFLLWGPAGWPPTYGWMFYSDIILHYLHCPPSSYGKSYCQLIAASCCIYLNYIYMCLIFTHTVLAYKFMVTAWLLSSTTKQKLCGMGAQTQQVLHTFAKVMSATLRWQIFSYHIVILLFWYLWTLVAYVLPLTFIKRLLQFWFLRVNCTYFCIGFRSLIFTW